MKIRSERFTVPEVLFNPSDIGINQAGIPETICQSLNKCPTEMHEQLYSNIVLTGGNCNIKGFKSRIESELESLKPSDVAVKVTQVD